MKIKSAWLLVLAVFLFLCGLDKVLGFAAHKKPLVERVIRLRELPPGLDVEEVISGDVMEYADGLREKKVRIRTDENGFIDPSIRYLKPDLTVVFLGGSTTECRLVEEENRFPYLAGKILEEKTGLKINSINSGVSGNHSLHSIDILLNKIIPLKPDVVVFHHNINDLVTLLLEGSYWNDNPRRSMIVKSTGPGFMEALKYVRYSLFRNIFDVVLSWPQWDSLVKPFRYRNFDEFARRRGTRITIRKENMLREFRMSLEMFIAVCRARGFEPVLMTQAGRIRSDRGSVFKQLEILKKDYGVEPADFSDLFSSFNGAIREAGIKEKVLVIDLEKAIPPQTRCLYDIVHYTDEGSLLAAQTIAREILPKISAKPGYPASGRS